MKKTAIAAALLMASSVQASTFDFAGTFFMWDSTGAQVGTTDTGVTGSFDFDMATGSGAGGAMSSPNYFFGQLWTADNIVMTGNADGTVNTDLIFHWGPSNIDVNLTLAMSPNADGTVSVNSSADVDGDGIPSTAMTSGPFAGFSPEFVGTATCTAGCAPAAVPVPAAVWLFGSGLVGLAGVARRRKAA